MEDEYIKREATRRSRMKKVICLILCAVMLLALCGCFNNAGKNETQENDGRMTVVYNDGWCIIYRDNETGVHYFSRANTGSCVMVNADGTPYTGEDAKGDNDAEKSH